MADSDDPTTAALAFEVYRDVMGMRGGPHFAARMPRWADLSPEIRQVWQDAAQPLIDREAEACASERQRIRQLAIDEASRQEADGAYYTTREVLLGFADLLDADT